MTARPFHILLLVLLVSGCASIASALRGAGTYAVAAPLEADLGGRGEIVGHILITSKLSEVMMDTGKPLPPSRGLETNVRVEALGIEIPTDPQGEFTLAHLEPGPYTIAFDAPGNREIWTEVDVEPNQRLDVVVWIQSENPTRGTESTPYTMMPGAQYEGLNVQSGRSSRSGRGGGTP